MPDLFSPSLFCRETTRACGSWQAWILPLLFLLCCAGLACYPPASAAQPAEQLELHESELQELRKELKKLQKSLAKKQGTQSAAKKEFKRTEIKIGEVAAQGHQITRQQQQLDQQLLQLHREQAELDKQRQSQRNVIARHLNSAYRAGDRNALTILFSESSPAEIDRQLRALEYINQAHN
ncbi:MAG: hypothetical protein HKO71_02835, partial [Pseudomonadales bacterium]|nr:hypothetical protein [Gammaproteobacteria bacterium]NNL56663.1 hypothetical protein [Pseudomonadales bacterium]